MTHKENHGPEIHRLLEEAREEAGEAWVAGLEGDDAAVPEHDRASVARQRAAVELIREDLAADRERLADERRDLEDQRAFLDKGEPIK